jgi:hypothetical protein
MTEFDKPDRCYDCGQIVYPEEAAVESDGLLFCELCADELPREDDNFPEAEISDYSGPCVFEAPNRDDYCEECHGH